MKPHTNPEASKASPLSASGAAPAPAGSARAAGAGTALPESKATGRPWQAGPNPAADDCASNQIVIRPAGEFPHGRWIADLGRAGDDEAHANAALIVTRVNGWDALVAERNAARAESHELLRRLADVRAEVARLRAALEGMERLVAYILPDRAQQHAHINGAGRTTQAEVVTLARARLAEIQVEERAIRAAARAALKGGAR